MKKIVFLFLLAFSVAKVKANPTDTLLNHQAKQITFQHIIGKPVKPNFYRNKILVLDFWATWCAPCIAGFPNYNALSKKYSSKEVVFANINCNEPLSNV